MRLILTKQQSSFPDRCDPFVHLCCNIFREAEGASNPGEADEDAGGAEAGKRPSGDGSEDGPASKKRKTTDQAPKIATAGASTCVF